jgi:hypothetical protein
MSPRKNNFELDEYYIQKSKRVRREFWLFAPVAASISLILAYLYNWIVN